MPLKAILKIVGPVMFFTGLSIAGCGIVSIIYGETPLPLFLSGGLAMLIGVVLYVMYGKVSISNLTIRDGAVVATLSWVLASLFGALPFYTMAWWYPDIGISFTKSVYESVSGLTTTGASIFSNVEVIPKGILFWRSFTHWIGGMGIVVLAIAILPKLGLIGGVQAFRMESPGPLKTDKLLPRIHDTAKILYTTYFVITVLLLICLLFSGVNLYDALIHTFGTVGTGGFSNYNLSVAGLQNHTAEYIIAIFMIMSGTNFALWYAVLKGDIKTLFRDSEARVYGAVVATAVSAIMIGLLVNHFNNWTIEESFRYALFHVATIITTTGYATNDFNLWPVFPVMVLVTLMFIGGSTGSTSGGLKILRHMINLKTIKQQILQFAKPNLIAPVRIGGRAIPSSIVTVVLTMTIAYLFIFVLGMFLLTMFNIDLVTAATASIANLGNIGPGLNLVGPVANFGWMPAPALWILIVEMLFGRLEVFTILVLFLPSVWSRK